jgi:hypothetical protein
MTSVTHIGEKNRNISDYVSRVYPTKHLELVEMRDGGDGGFNESKCMKMKMKMKKAIVQFLR